MLYSEQIHQKYEGAVLASVHGMLHPTNNSRLPANDPAVNRRTGSILVAESKWGLCSRSKTGYDMYVRTYPGTYPVTSQ